MHWLYIFLWLSPPISSVHEENPVPDPVPLPKIVLTETSKIGNNGVWHMYENNRNSGEDERWNNTTLYGTTLYGTTLYDTTLEEEKRLRISLWMYYYYQIRFLENYSMTNREEVTKNDVIHDILKTNEISPGRMIAGGLLDDWNRNIF
jgi:hypothetical protein